MQISPRRTPLRQLSTRPRRLVEECRQRKQIDERTTERGTKRREREDKSFSYCSRLRMSRRRQENTIKARGIHPG